MIRILIAAVVSACALITASCCCTGEVKPPGLRPLPQFQEIETTTTTTPEVRHTK
ncbi:MAG: hypothetical protein WED15_05865 [Akkermansiaceae bacterium]